ncbi:MAG: glycosyltransferase family 2 protein [Candidatus Woesebacteria bacterium]|jgi:glycosyltransferase involved in cell wall biosynthesis
MKQKDKNLLAVTIIIFSHRADKRFKQALKSSQFAKEILVFDYQSQNNWTELKKNFHFKLINKDKKISNFAKARNQALLKSKFDWVFFLDSDEIIESDSINQIRKIIKNNDYNAASIIRKDYFHNQELKWGETANKRSVRLLKKYKVQFKRSVHEVAKIKGKIKKSKIVLHHHAHNDVSEFLNKINFYSQLEAEFRQLSKVQSKLKIILEMLFYPSAKFILNYFLKLGILDGFRGLIYAMLMSIHSLNIRVMLYEKNT